MYQLVSLLFRLIEAYETLIVVECIMSWIPRSPGSFIDDIHLAIKRLTDPFLDIFRGIMPSFGGSGVSIDFSPIVAIVALNLLQRLILVLL
jgi:YggT family protein